MAEVTKKDLRREVPAWWRDAKLGIFVHWTPASVAGFAPTGDEIGDRLASGMADALAENPYTEWYANSLRFPGSSAARHHHEVWHDRPYEDFADDFRAGLEQWDPEAWAERFAATGARYVVLVTKHHDGFCLWPSEVTHPDPRWRGWHTGRDVVGELAEAVRGAGMRFGVYYSGGLDWTFEDRPIGSMADLVLAVPRGDYPAYADAQVRELIERYRPSVLWNDIRWPDRRRPLFRLFADYYRAVPDGVVNDRWMPWHPAMGALEWAPLQRAARAATARSARNDAGLVPPTPPHFDVRTPEYTTFPDIQRRAWECVRGIDRSFGYNRASDESHFLGRDELVGSLADIAAKGGNLLLNVGPRGEDAQIPEAQLRRLGWLAEWTAAGDGEALFATRPWVRPEATSPEGHELRFTCRDRTVFAAVVSGPATGPLTVPGVLATPATTVRLVGGTDLAFSAEAAGLRVELGGPGDHPVLALDAVDAAPA